MTSVMSRYWWYAHMRERICACLVSDGWNLYVSSGTKMGSICSLNKLKECSLYLVNMLEDNDFFGIIVYGKLYTHLVGLEATTSHSTLLLCGEEVPFELVLIGLFGLTLVTRYHKLPLNFPFALYELKREKFKAALLCLIPDFWHC